MEKLLEKLKKEYDKFLKNANIESNNINKLEEILNKAFVGIEFIKAISEKHFIYPDDIIEKLLEKDDLIDTFYKIWKFRNKFYIENEVSMIFSILCQNLENISDNEEKDFFVKNSILNSEKIMAKIQEELEDLNDNEFDEDYNLNKHLPEIVIKNSIVKLLEIMPYDYIDETIEERLLKSDNLLNDYYEKFNTQEIYKMIENLTQKIFNSQISLLQDVIPNNKEEN